MNDDYQHDTTEVQSSVTHTSKNGELGVPYPSLAVGKEHLRLMQSCIRYNCT